VTSPARAARERTRRERLAVIGSRLGPYARPYRARLGTALVASLGVTAAQLALPFPMSWLVGLAAPTAGGSAPDWLSLGGDPELWVVASLVLVGVVLGASEYLQRVSLANYVVRTVNDARVGILTGLVESPERPGTKRRDPGDIVTRVVGDTARLRVGMRGALVHLLQHGLFLVGVSVVLLTLDVWLGLAYLGGIAVSLAVAVVGADLTATLSRRRRGRESRVAGQALRLAATPGEDAAVRPVDRERSVAIISQIKGRTAVLVQALLALTACLVLTLAVRFADSGRLGPGDVALVSSYLLMLHYPMMRMGRQITRLGPQLTSAERLARLAPPTRTGTGTA
jgi:ABC-type multidrug transport system fused ATPase/permease subunit